MKKITNILFIFLLIAFLLSCKDDIIQPIDDNDNTDSTENPVVEVIPFDKVPNTEDIVMYEVNLRAFSQNGDFEGVTNRLDNIKALGVNVIWLMPIHPVGEVKSLNSPYSIKNFKQVSSEYGTIDDLKNLVNEAHKRQMAVILDWVANHTAWDCNWITNAGWYTVDNYGNIIHPAGTNWQDVADLNYNNTTMRAAMIDAMKYWVTTANIDGFRCDYADGVPYEFWKAAIDTLKKQPNRKYILLAEGNRNDHFAAGFNLTYGWEYYGKLKAVYNGQPANELFTIHTNEYINIPAGGHKLRFTTNHDESAWDNTPMVIFNGEKGALTASVITIFMGGAPLIFSSQEVGRVEKVPFFTKSPINWSNAPNMLQSYQNILSFYNQSDVARKGSITHLSNSNVVCFKKTYNNAQLLIIANVRNYATDFALPIELQNTTWTDALSNTAVTLGTSVALSNYQHLILKK